MPCQRHNFKKEKKNSQILKKKNLIFLFFSFLCCSCSFLTNKHIKIHFFSFISLSPKSHSKKFHQTQQCSFSHDDPFTLIYTNSQIHVTFSEFSSIHNCSPIHNHSNTHPFRILCFTSNQK